METLMFIGIIGLIIGLVIEIICKVKKVENRWKIVTYISFLLVLVTSILSSNG